MLDSTLLTSGYFGMHPPKPPGTRCESSQKGEEKVTLTLTQDPGCISLGEDGVYSGNRMGG